MVAAFNNFINLTGNSNPFDQGNRAGKDAGGHAAPRPHVKSFAQIRSNLLQPALTSHFVVHITEPEARYGWPGVKAENNIETIGFANKQDQLMLLCSEALLPGSTFATHQITSDRTGVTERHVYRRQFDDRIDLTFLVNAGENAYLPIRFFETWMKFISAEGNQQGNSVRNPAYSYRVRYPAEYYGGLTVTKFERSHDSEIKYNFLNAYPTSIVSMPVSYDTSQLMKCTVSFSYVRYWIDEVPGEANPPTSDVMDYKKPGPPSKPVIAPPPEPSSYSKPTPSAPGSKTQQMVDRDNELYGDTVPEGSFGITKKASSPTAGLTVNGKTMEPMDDIDRRDAGGMDSYIQSGGLPGGLRPR